ncbi:hypothetical protein [Haloprofundus sp. MHR1]|uniref:DUF7261 family protein n=1 Tax=Haloprofundus sp. MHR1 TaxID=2572921 RepID=UPI0010BE5AE9|nr:hypothetical protein [Haloprofundus sp. MHR1]QCJ47857.1 hypothetical protein FCF25_12350 [Haloprofundus sp. MHR1]
MADVSRLRDGPWNDVSRAQLFLVGALSLAVVFVALSLILNSAIYTENLASRSTDAADASAALDTRADVETGVAGLIAYENRNRESFVEAEVETAVEGGVDELNSQIGDFSVRNGRVVQVSYVSLNSGTAAEQSANEQSEVEQFVSAEDSTTDWTVASGHESFRAFEQRVKIGSLALSEDDAFATEFTADDGETYQVRLLRVNDDDLRVKVVRLTSEGEIEESNHCALYDDASADEYVTVDLTSATVGGEPCPALEFFEDSVAYDVAYVNGDQVSGTYRLVVDGSADVSEVPESKEVIYAVTVDFAYSSSELDYETTIRVAPGEPNV